MAENSSSSSVEYSSSSSIPVVVNTSSSSSNIYSSSSSSKDSSSSSELSSSSISSKSTSSASSLSTSSSSSIDSSSSSSSSLFEFNGERVIPFLWDGVKRNDVNCFIYSGQNCFVGMSGNGEIIASSNRFHWTKYFHVNDYSAQALFVYNDNLFAASAPKGKIYKINLSDNSFSLIQTLNKAAVSFFEFNNILYLCTLNHIYQYSSVTNRFSFVYQTYGNITNVFNSTSNVFIGIDKENIIVFDGKKFTSLPIKNDNISSIRKVSTNPFSKVSFDFIKREEFKFQKLDVQDYISIMPYNKESGISSIAFLNGAIIAGGKNFSRLFEIKQEKINIIFDSDESGVKYILPVTERTFLSAIGESLYLGFFGSIENSTKNKWNFVKVMELQNEFITTMSIDNYYEQILIGTSKGRILSTNSLKLNAYATGNRKVYAYAKSTYGKRSNVADSNLLYSLHKRVIEINENKKIEKWKFSRMAAINKNETITGVFISPIINIKNDFGFWKNLIWEETKNNDDKIRIFLKSANSINELYLKDWQFGFESKANEYENITRNLNNVNLIGNFLQIKVEMDCKSNLSMVSKISVEYSTKNASYFYTTYFEMNTDEISTKGLITANITQNPNTEIIFGIAKTNSSDWNDYQVIEKDRFFNIDNFKNIKIGVKLVSYDSSLPEVSEFALMRNK